MYIFGAYAKIAIYIAFLQKTCMHAKTFHINADGSINLDIPTATFSDSMYGATQYFCPHCNTGFAVKAERDIHMKTKCGPKQRVSARVLTRLCCQKGHRFYMIARTQVQTPVMTGS